MRGGGRMRETRHRRPSRRRRSRLTEEAKWGLAMAGLLVVYSLCLVLVTKEFVLWSVMA